MRNPRVFLSHSGNEGVVKNVLDQLEAALELAGFEPLVDRKHIPLGADFPKQIDEFIAICDAAVFVISPRALSREHRWVFAEANRLHDRMTHSDFQALPVFIEGASPDQLDGDWEAAGLKRQNGIVGGKPATIAARVVEALAYTRDVVHAEPVAEEVAGLLENISPRALRNAAQKLAEGWIAGDLGLQVARRLLAATDDRIVAFAEALAPTHPVEARATLRLALPFTWIDRDVARTLCTAILDERRPAALNTALWSMAEYHLQCGWTSFPYWELKRRGQWLEGEKPEGLLDQALRDLGRADGNSHEDQPLDDDFDEDELTDDDFDPNDLSEPFVTDVVLAYDISVLDVDLVAVLERLAQLNGVGVVVLSGRGQWEPELSERIPRLNPRLDREGELRVLKQLKEARAMVKRKYLQAHAIRTGVPRDSR